MRPWLVLLVSAVVAESGDALAGRYQLSGSPTWIGDPDGTLAFGMAIDVVPGGSYVVYGGNAAVGQRLRVGVFDVIKGTVGREVTS